MSLTSTLGISNYLPSEYLRALLVFVILLVLIRIILTYITKILVKLTRKTKSDLDDIILKRSSKPLTLLAFLFSLIISVQELTLSEKIQPVIDKLILSAIFIVIGYLLFVIIDITIIRIWKKFTSKTETEIDDALINLGHSALKAGFIVLVFLYLLNLWGIAIGPFLAGLGIAGLAVALALQPTLSNIFSGIALIIDQTFKIGDVIKLDSGEMGTVHQIGLRTTRINTFDNEMIIVPNSNIANARVQNFFQPDKRIRVNVEFGVEYGTDPEYIKKLAIEEIEKIKILDEKEEVRVLFLTMGDNSLNFKAMFWVNDISKKWPAHQEAITRIYRRLYKEGIGIPFPQRTVWIRDEGKASSLNPKDNKFSKHNSKFYSNFGHEYKSEEEKNDNIEKSKSDSKEKAHFSFKSITSKFKKKK